MNVPTLKGIHYAIESGILAAETAFRALQRGESPGRRGRARAVRRGAARELRLQGPARGPEHAAGLRQGLLHGRRTRERDDRDEGQPPAEGVRDGAERLAQPHPRRPRAELSGARRQAHVRQALVGLPLREPHARRPAEPHPHPAARAARPRGGVGAHVPRAGVRGGRGRRRRHGHGHAESVELRPVRRDHRQGRQAHTARGRLRARVHAGLRGHTRRRARRRARRFAAASTGRRPSPRARSASRCG